MQLATPSSSRRMRGTTSHDEKCFFFFFCVCVCVHHSKSIFSRPSSSYQEKNRAGKDMSFGRRYFVLCKCTSARVGGDCDRSRFMQNSKSVRKDEP